MAGDKKGEQRKVIQREGQRAQGLGEELRGGVLNPQLDMFRNYYQDAANKASSDYATQMGQYQDFAKTGGFAPTDLANIRARALSPTRAVYANAQRNVNRQRALQGGYSPGFGVLQARMAREQGQGLSDAATNTEAAIAQMVQQGKLAGMQGGTSLYGTTPGMANMFGNQVLGATGQLQRGYENEMGLGMDIVNANQNAQQLPGKWEGTLGRIGDIANIATGVASIPWGGGTPFRLPQGKNQSPYVGF